MINIKENERLSKLNHSCAHLLAQAVKHLYPDALFWVGPVIEDGFYYDIDLNGKTLTEDDLTVIEKEMKKCSKDNKNIVRHEITKEEALKMFKNDPYKIDLISRMDENEQVISCYTQGDFTDLCRGPHVDNTKELKNFKLLKVSGAYWKNVKNSLFNKKVEIEVIRHDDVIEYIKEYLKELIKNMGLTCNLEVKKRENGVNITVISDNNSILIGKNGRTLNALNQLLKQVLYNEIGEYFPFNLDIGEYKVEREHKLESLAKRTAREVAISKVEAKLDPMNSYERRIIHTALADNKKVITESEGEEPNRYVVIKPKEDE